MSLKALSEYTFYSRYSHYLPNEKRRETWKEAVKRVFDMHREKYKKEIAASEELQREINFAEQQVLKKRVLGAQRTLQFGGDSIFKHEMKGYNCSFTLCDRLRVFQEIEYALLCGTGVGISVQEQHVRQLPDLIERHNQKTFQIEDSIEGWADAFGVLISSFVSQENAVFPDFSGKFVKFDFSKIRPKGDLIANKFVAPGPEGLKQSLEKCRVLIEKRISNADFKKDKFANKLRPIDCYDFIAHMSDSVLSGGIRRSALLVLFSYNDKEMMEAKIGNWFIENPQRARSNNSAVLERGKATKEQFETLIKFTKEYGDPGFYFVEDDERDCGPNPCFTGDTKILTDKGWEEISQLVGQNRFIKQDNRVQGEKNETGEVWNVDLSRENVNVENFVDEFYLTQKNAEVFEMDLSCGRKVKATKDHHFATKDGMKSLKDITNEDYVLIPLNSLAKIDKESDDFKLGHLAGLIYGDGCIPNQDENPSARIDLWGNEHKELLLEIEKFVFRLIEEEKESSHLYGNQVNWNPKFKENSGEVYGAKKKHTLASVPLYRILNKKLGIVSKGDIDWIYDKSENVKAGFISGMFYADGHTEYNDKSKSLSLRLGSVNFNILQSLQLVLQELGLFSKINLLRKSGYSLMPDSNREPRKYKTKEIYRLIIAGRECCENALKVLSLHPKDEKRIKETILKSQKKLKPRYYSKVKEINPAGEKDVYCLTENSRRTLIAEGMTARRCVEIGMYPKTEAGISGFQLCNLSEINGKFCKDEESFFQACRAASIIGTLQAGYSDFKYVTPETKKIVEREALLGVSITGLMDNPDVLFDPETQKEGAKAVVGMNKKISSLLGINPAARLTCIKPSGSASCLLSTGSGIHPHHAKKYIRRAQANDEEFTLNVFKEKNPLAVEKSVWSATGTDYSVSFLCEVPPGAITKNQITAIDFLEKVKTTQRNWVLEGTNKEHCVNKNVNHNVSVTVVVKPEEWREVIDYIWENRQYFTGISLLSASGDLDYKQAPFSTVLTPKELIQEYGDASVFASGLIVDGLTSFNDDLWGACDTVLGFGEANNLQKKPVKPEYPSKRNNKQLAEYFLQKEIYDEWFLKTDWIRRVQQFAERYFGGDVRKATYCLKHVSLWKRWVDLKREYKDVDWENLIEERQELVDAGSLAAQSCSGSKCEINL